MNTNKGMGDYSWGWKSCALCFWQSLWRWGFAPADWARKKSTIGPSRTWRPESTTGRLKPLSRWRATRTAKSTSCTRVAWRRATAAITIPRLKAWPRWAISRKRLCILSTIPRLRMRRARATKKRPLFTMRFYSLRTFRPALPQCRIKSSTAIWQKRRGK